MQVLVYHMAAIQKLGYYNLYSEIGSHVCFFTMSTAEYHKAMKLYILYIQVSVSNIKT